MSEKKPPEDPSRAPKPPVSPEPAGEAQRAHDEAELDEALDESFPASDPISTLREN